MSNPNWNKKLAVIPPTEVELEATYFRGAPPSRLTRRQENAVVAAGLSRRPE